MFSEQVTKTKKTAIYNPTIKNKNIINIINIIEH